MLTAVLPLWIRAKTASALTKGVAFLTIGNIIGQGIVICSYPLLTRLFTPYDFGVLAVYSSIMGWLSVVAALRYEWAIPLPDEDNVAVDLMALSLCLTLITSVLVGAVVLVFGHWIVSATHIGVNPSYLLLIPVGLFAASAYQVIANWALRRQRFRAVARSKVTQGVMQSASQLGFGLLRLAPVGLLLGDFIGQSGAVVAVWMSSRENIQSVHSRISVGSMVSAASRYRRFPVFSSWSALLNTGSLQLPPVLFAALYGPQVAGWLSLSWRALVIPSVLVGEAVSQVYFVTASRLARANPSAVLRLFSRMTLALLLVGALPALGMVLFGPQAFRILFGGAWHESGVYVQILSVAFLAQFAVGSLSRTLTLLELQPWQLAWDIGRFTIVVGGLALVGHFGLSSRWAVAIYSGGLSFAYVALFAISIIALRRRRALVNPR
jgi:O-antigen/teichoic acid export membrane protein